MEIGAHWPEIKAVLARGQASSFHCAIATLDANGAPHITPMGTVFLRDDQTGFVFDHYTQALAANLDADPRLCLMAVDSSFWFWLRSLFLGRFTAPPGVRLHGRAGRSRPATAAELELVNRRLRATKWLKGARLLWGDFSHVRDLTFTGFSPVVYPVMTEGLWRGENRPL